LKINKQSGRIIIAAVAVAAFAIYLMWPMEDRAPGAITEGLFQPISDIGTATTDTTTSSNDGQQRVAVGGGNLTMSINKFTPSDVQIQPGQNVTFYAPIGSTELHNVVFDLSGSTAISSLELGFILPPGLSAGALQLAPPDNFGEPIIQNMSDGRQSIVALNKVLFHPSTIGQDGHATFLQEQELIQQMEQGGMQQGLSLSPSFSADYTMQGNEAIVSSGLILDVNGFAPLEQSAQEQVGAEGQQQQQQQEPTQQGIEEESLPPAYPILSNFTVTFNEPGAYPFFCAFHPGMAGVVNVADAVAAQNQTGT
jgi:plastocyanin